MADELDEMDLNASAYADLLEYEGGKARPVAGFRLLVYIDEDGEQSSVWKVDGQLACATMLGELEWARHAMIHRHEEENG